MVATENADKVGEFSLTDRRFSRITKFMAETLYDENVGGPFGNTHIALGKSYHDCYAGDPASVVTPEEWERLGFNESSVHTDIVSTTDRTVTATAAPTASEQVIYAFGRCGLASSPDELRDIAAAVISSVATRIADGPAGGGSRGPRLTGPRHVGMIAVPIAKNSITWLPQPCERSWRSTPTMPSALASSASACIRSIASSRAS
jgi:hypothetical protein